MEEQIYIGKKKVYVRKYIADFNGPTLIIIPNIGWYHVGPNRMFSQLAQINYDNGINTYVFDYLGEGESLGNINDIGIKDLIYSFEEVYNYVKSRHTENIFCMSIGIGNLILNSLYKNLKLEGVIYYLPPTESLKSNINLINTSFDSSHNTSVLPNIRKNHEFWRSFVGPYHDCSYNPINNKLLKDTMPFLKDYKVMADARNVLIISDKEDVNTDFYKKNILLVEEYRENILPLDWKNSEWPKTIYKVNNHISNWVESNKKKKQGEEKKSYTYKEVTSTIQLKKTFRKLISYQENQEKEYIPIVKHYNYSEAKETRGIVIFLPGLGGDKVDNYKCGPRLGDFFAEKGYIFFRYDNRFSGSSKKGLENFTWSKVISDFDDFMKYISTSEKINTSNIFLIGWSEGAKVVSYALSQYPNITGACLWNPIIDDNQEKNRKSVKFTVNNKKVVTSLAGEFLSIDFFIDSKKWNFMNYLKENKRPIKILWGEKDILSETYKSLYPYYGKHYEIIETNHHLFSFVLIDTLIQKSFNWISSFNKL